MKVLDDVLGLLKDGEWHRILEIQKIGLTPFKAQLIANFLISYGFCDYTQGSFIKLKDNVKEFFEELNKLETDMEHLKNV